MKYLEDKIMVKTRELEDLTLLSQEDLFEDFGEFLTECNWAQKHQLISMLSTLHELC